MSYDIRFDFVWEDGQLSVEPCVIELDSTDADSLREDLEERYGSDACVTGTVDEDGNFKIESVEEVA